MAETVVVTGATGGVGSAVVRAYADDGATVVAGGRDAEKLDDLVEMVDGVVGVRTDVRDEFDVERLMELAAREGGEVDLVVPCAVVYHGEPGGTPLDEESYSAFDDSLRTNARGVFSAVREALPHLAPDGRVVVPTGSVARESRPGFGAYAVSKAAAAAVVRGFAADVEQAVGSLDLGTVATSLTDYQGREPAEAAEMIRWAADLDADALDGALLTRGDWREATAD
jgi:NAD(P)-dependent dehydrogenase (short-subunit alcohol dehydrogenase family)